MSGEAVAPLRWTQSGLRWLWLSVLLLVVDQATKALIVQHYALYESTYVLPVLDILRAHNTGAAFSFLADAGGWQRWAFAALALGVSAVLLVWLRRIDAQAQRWLAIGLALVVSGAIGNLIDRLRFGYVVDFVAVHWNQAYFPAFNVADSAITVGAVLLILDALLEGRRGGQG
jgi:signal peptidase II